MRLIPETDYPERLRPGRAVWLFPSGSENPAEAREDRLTEVCPGAPGSLLVRMRGIANRESAAAFTGGTLRVPADALPDAGPGRYYHHQLIGLLVKAPDGHVVGSVIDVLVTGANDVFVVRRTGRRDLLVPATREAVEAVDVARGEMRLGQLGGLLED